MAYVDVRVLRHLKEELAWATANVSVGQVLTKPLFLKVRKNKILFDKRK